MYHINMLLKNILYSFTWTEEPGGLQSMESKESDMSEWLSRAHSFMTCFFS